MTTLTHSSPLNRAIPVKFPSLNWKVFFILGFALFSFLIIFYIFEINELTKGSYLIKNYEKQLKEISGQSRILEMNFAKTNLLGSIQEKTKELNFEKTKQVKYIQILDPSLAKAK